MSNVEQNDCGMKPLNRFLSFLDFLAVRFTFVGRHQELRVHFRLLLEHVRIASAQAADVLVALRCRRSAGWLDGQSAAPTPTNGWSI